MYRIAQAAACATLQVAHEKCIDEMNNVHAAELVRASGASAQLQEQLASAKLEAMAALQAEQEKAVRIFSSMQLLCLLRRQAC